MLRTRRLLKNSQYGLLALLLVATSLCAPWLVKPAHAANFSMQTGYYMGTGSAGLAISGLGFQPNFVMIKSSTIAGVAVFKTSAMPANTIAYTSATANNTATNITLTSDGFTLGTLANVNSANVLYNYIAIGGSDCSASGNFCVGTYTGNNAGNRDIAVGFQPEMAIVKRSTAVAGHFRVNSEPANETLFFTNLARDTVGGYIRAFGATTFQVGATDNANSATYYYVAFSTTAGAFSEGTYAGNGADNRSITGLGYTPSFVMAKNATSATAGVRDPLMNATEHYGDNSSYVGIATANIVNGIQALESDGFQVGTSGQVNESGATIYWFSFGGAGNFSTSGSFSMNTGSYTGTGSSQSISGIGFQPDLVLVTSNNGTTVFRTALMAGDTTAHTAVATANFTGGITSLNATGFSVGTAAQTNTNGTTYHWQAFGGGFDPYVNTGASDFAIGAYYGNGTGNRNITRIPWQPDMVSIKHSGATAGTWRSSAQAGNLSSFFGATAETSNNVQTLTTDGFQIGSIANVNTAATVYYWFAFKEGSHFDVGTYTGTGSAQSITGTGFRPEGVWVKRSTAVNGVLRAVSLTGDSTQYFAGTANASDRIVSFVKNGFRVGGSQTETNVSTATYRYAAWNDADYGSLGFDIVDSNGASVASPSSAMNNLATSFACTTVNGTLGAASQKLRISNLTTSPAWNISIAATSGATSRWRNGGDTQRYDYNDPTGSPAGCSDGADGDNEAGQLTIDASAGTITSEAGCTTTNLSLGGSAAFSEGSVNSVDLLTASSGANADCIWDLTGIVLTQRVPAEQSVDNYSANMTITVVAN